MSTTQSVMRTAKRVVVKVGSSLVTNMGQGVNQSAIENWALQIHSLIQDGREIVWVSSGAIAEGMKRLGWKERPTNINELQAAAAVGQVGLVATYETVFAKFGIQCAQVLLTHDDLRDRERYLNARQTLLTLLSLGVIPIINENDTVVTDEIKFGDNDTLGALVANLIEADCLVILTDQPGLFTADPRKDPDAVLVKQGLAGDPQYEEMAGGAGSRFGKGGMITKILAAKRAASSGASTIIAPGAQPGVLQDLSKGILIGTELRAQTQLLSAKKQWMSDHLQVKGWVVIDNGAVEKLRFGGKSLLPVGVKDVHGEFVRGEVIICKDQLNQEVARGIANYSSVECRLLMGKNSQSAEDILGYPGESALIHRDNMVLK